MRGPRPRSGLQPPSIRMKRRRTSPLSDQSGFNATKHPVTEGCDPPEGWGGALSTRSWSTLEGIPRSRMARFRSFSSSTCLRAGRGNSAARRQEARCLNLASPPSPRRQRAAFTWLAQPTQCRPQCCRQLKRKQILRREGSTTNLGAYVSALISSSLNTIAAG